MIGGVIRIVVASWPFSQWPLLTSAGGFGREDDDAKVDNVVCRTPARNAQNLDAVKNEILEMVDHDVSGWRVLGGILVVVALVLVY